MYNITLMGDDLTAGSIRLEPALKAAVVAVAAYFRVSNITLMQCVRRVERQMAAMESSIAHSLSFEIGHE